MKGGRNAAGMLLECCVSGTVLASTQPCGRGTTAKQAAGQPAAAAIQQMNAHRKVREGGRGRGLGLALPLRQREPPPGLRPKSASRTRGLGPGRVCMSKLPPPASVHIKPNHPSRPYCDECALTALVGVWRQRQALQAGVNSLGEVGCAGGLLQAANGPPALPAAQPDKLEA